jgi:hypothetical protein
VGVTLLIAAFGVFLAANAIGGGGPGAHVHGLAAGPVGPPVIEGDSVIIPAGTEIPFRFIQGTAGAHTGATLFAQTLGAVARDSCGVLPPYLAVRGQITASHRGWFGRRSELTVRFDALELAPGVYAPLDAVADSLEYVSMADIGDSGQIYGGRPHAGRVGGAVLAKRGLALARLTVLPAAGVQGYLLFRRTAPVRLFAGEVGRLRVLQPVVVPDRPACERVAEHPDLSEPLALPEFVPRTTNRAGTGAGDPINVVVLGTLEALDTAFTRAGWELVHAHTGKAVAGEVVAAIRGHHAAVGAPVSTEYFAGRPQDAAYELPGPTASIRHHIRFWRLDDAPGVLVGSGNEDVGLVFDPLRGRATHRVDPQIDRERDYIAAQLEAGGCADLVGFDRLPGAVTQARTATGQTLETDGRAAVIRVPPASDSTRCL